MICPKCGQNTIRVEPLTKDETKMVSCSNCSFRTTLLEYHAWQDIHERRAPRRIFRAGKPVYEKFDFSETREKVGELWNTIRTPILIIIFILMLAMIIIVARE